MDLWIIFVTIGFAPFVLSNGGFSLEPCELTDLQCLGKSTDDFLEMTSKGRPEYDIRPIDPWILKFHTRTNGNVKFVFEDTKITGLKKQKIDDFKLDYVTKSVVLKTKSDVHIVAKVTVEKGADKVTTTYTADASVLNTASYNYEVKKNEKGDDHFMIGPELITCDVVGTPKITLNPDLDDSYKQEPTVLDPEIACSLVQLAYVDVVHNIRAGTKILPASAFFKLSLF